MASDDHDEDVGGESGRRFRSREALRETVVLAGLELLAKRGLTLTYESITYTKVFAYLESEYSVRVTRGSVHERIWGNQEDFRRDVVAESIRFFEEGHLTQALLRRAAKADDRDQFAKDIGSRMYPQIIESRSFGQFQSIKALASRLDDPEATLLLQRFLDDRAERSLSQNRESFAVFMASLGVQPKRSLGLDHDQTSDLFRTLITGLTVGGQVNQLSGAADISNVVTYLSTPAGSPDPWRTVSIGIKAFLDFLFEPADEVQAVTSVPSTQRQRLEPRTELFEESLLTPPSRRSRDRLKKLVLTAAVELLMRDGLDLQAESLGYSTVFAHIQQTQGRTINRASVHGRIWASNDDYRAEVLSRSINPAAKEFMITSDAMRGFSPVLAADGSVDRQLTKNEYLRDYGKVIPTAGAMTRRTLLQVKAALIDQRETSISLVLRAAVQGAEAERVRLNKIELQHSILDLGFQARPENGLTEDQALDQVMLLSMTTVTGLTLNRLAGIEAGMQPTTLPVDAPDGERVDWTPTALALRCFVDQFYEEVDAT